MDKKLKEILIKFGLTIIVVLFLITLVTKRSIYFRPGSVLLPVNETYKVIKQGHLYGWFAESSPGSKAVLICHSNKGNISHNTDLISKFKSIGYTVLAFDYSGFGKSHGIPSEQQLYEDASYMVALLRQTYQCKNIILYGHGLGAPVATYVARRYDIPTLILVSPFLSAKSIVNNTPLKYISWIFSEFNTEEYLNGYKGRSLMIHSKNDEVVPYDTTIMLQRLATFHIPSSGTHENIVIPWEQVRMFIDEEYKDLLKGNKIDERRYD